MITFYNMNNGFLSVNNGEVKMKNYIVEILIGYQSVKKYVVETLDIAEMIADYCYDDITDVVIREVATSNHK